MQTASVEVLHWDLFSLLFSKSPFSIFGLKAFVGRISQLLPTLFIRARGFWVGGEMAINQVKGKEEEIPGLSHVLTHKWVSSALSAHSLASIRDSRHYSTHWFPRGNSFFVSLTQEHQCRQAGRVGTRSSLHAHSDRLCLEIPSLQSLSPRAAWLRFSEGFGTSRPPQTWLQGHRATLLNPLLTAPSPRSPHSPLNHIPPEHKTFHKFTTVLVSPFPHFCSHWMPQTELSVPSLPLVRHEKGVGLSALSIWKVWSQVMSHSSTQHFRLTLLTWQILCLLTLDFSAFFTHTAPPPLVKDLPAPPDQEPAHSTPHRQPTSFQKSSQP